MNSEKVKEIKKALEDNKTDHLPYIDGWKCKFVEYADILALINELESENERLNKSDASKEESSIEYYNLYKDLKRKNKDLNELCERQRVSIAESFVRKNQLKDRIAKLEKEVETRKAEVVYENVDYCYEDLKKAQDRIAELEKEKTCVWEEWTDGDNSIWCCSNCKEDFCFIEGDVYENNYGYCPHCGAKITALKELKEDDINETLKEFINE